MSNESSQIKKAGLRITSPRITVLHMLEQAKQNAKHLTAEDIYKKLLLQDENVGLATVYRVLTQFEQAGLVERHQFDKNISVYELASEEHHDHMVCLHTGKVTEFCDDRIEALQQAIAEKYNYKLVSHSLVLYVRPDDTES